MPGGRETLRHMPQTDALSGLNQSSLETAASRSTACQSMAIPEIFRYRIAVLTCRIPIGPTPAAAAYAGIDCEQAMHATESAASKQLLDLAAHSKMLYQVPLSKYIKCSAGNNTTT